MTKEYKLPDPAQILRSLLQLLSKKKGGKKYSIMYKVCAALLFAGASLANPAPSHHKGPQCHVVYDVVHNKHCETYYDEVCHEEYDVIVDTTYIEECADIVTEHCSEVSKQVHHSSAVVGHDSKVVSHGYGYGKRDAEAEPGYGSQGYSSGPQCQQHVEKQCQKVPHQTQRQIPRQVCVPVEVKVPYEVCGTSYVQKQQYNTGYGYH